MGVCQYVVEVKCVVRYVIEVPYFNGAYENIPQTVMKIVVSRSEMRNKEECNCTRILY